MRRPSEARPGCPTGTPGRTPLAELLDRFVDAAALGLTTRAKRTKRPPSPRQVKLIVTRIRTVLDGCGLTHPADLADGAAAKVARYLQVRVAIGRVQDGGFSHQSAAFHLAAARRFVWWLSTKGRVPVRADLLDDVPGFDPAGNRVHARREIAPAELAGVLNAARSDTRPPYKGLDSEAR